MRCYVDGVEIDKLPEFKEVCAADEWSRLFANWVATDTGASLIDVIVQAEGTNLDDARVLEVWVGGAPPGRAGQIGGILKTLTKEGKGGLSGQRGRLQ